MQYNLNRDYNAISDIMWMRKIKDNFLKISLLNILAPIGEKDIKEKEKFHEEIDRWYNKIPKYDIKIILGDFNLKIGVETI